jgi:hypothetical protein
VYQWHEDSRFHLWRRRITGSGSAYIRWEMIVLDSSNNARFNFPSSGSVTATLHRRGVRYGRREMRLRALLGADGLRSATQRAQKGQ